MIALDAALRRLTVCQLTRKSRGNGGGLRPRVWLRLRAAAGGNWTPDGILQLEGEANFSLSWGMKRTQKLLCMGLFSKKLNGPLLTGLTPRARRPCGDGREANGVFYPRRSRCRNWRLDRSQVYQVRTFGIRGAGLGTVASL